MTVFARTIVGETKAEVEAKVQKAIAQGWHPIGHPGRLYVGGQQVEGRAKWYQQMQRQG